MRAPASAARSQRAKGRAGLLADKLRARAQGPVAPTAALEPRPPSPAKVATKLAKLPRFGPAPKVRGKRGPPAKRATRPARPGRSSEAAARAGDRTRKTWSAEKSLTNGGALGLLAVGARQVHRFGSFNRATGEILGVVAPVALAIGSVYGLSHAGSGEDRVDAVHGLLWAAQGGAEVGSSSVHGLATAGVVTGVAGGGLQVGVGIYRLYSGWKARSLPRIIGGALDVTAGSAWALSAVSVATPVTMGVFIGATAAKMLYENRAAIARGARRMGAGMTRWFAGFLGRRPSFALAAK